MRSNLIQSIKVVTLTSIIFFISACGEQKGTGEEAGSDVIDAEEVESTDSEVNNEEERQTISITDSSDRSFEISKPLKEVVVVNQHC